MRKSKVSFDIGISVVCGDVQDDIKQFYVDLDRFLRTWGGIHQVRFFVTGKDRTRDFLTGMALKDQRMKIDIGMERAQK